MRQLYAPMKLGNAGTVPALLQPGTELGWQTLAGAKPLDLARDTMKYVVFKDPAWDISRFNPAKDYDLAMLADSDKVLSLTDPNLKPFFDRGGKLIVYHGWADPQVPAQGSVKYFNDVLKTVGRERRRQFDSAVHDAGHGPLPRRGRSRYVRQDGGDRIVRRHRQSAGADRRLALDRRQSRSHAAALPLRPGGEMEGHRQHRRCREFCVCGRDR